MMTLRHDGALALPPLACNTRLSYSHRCAARIGKAAEEEMKDDDRRAGKQHEPITGRQQQNGEGPQSPATPIFRYQRQAATAKRFLPRCSPEQSG